jgi:hypothetical protein
MGNWRSKKISPENSFVLPERNLEEGDKSDLEGELNSENF